MKAIVIGRHTTEIPEVEVVESRNITFTSDTQAREVVLSLFQEALQKEVVILFQNVPAIAATAICRMYWNGKAGIIISKPGKRESGKIVQFEFDSCLEMDTAERAIKTVNPNAKTATNYTDGILEVTVDPPMVFEFSHIEWL